MNIPEFDYGSIDATNTKQIEFARWLEEHAPKEWVRKVVRALLELDPLLERWPDSHEIYKHDPTISKKSDVNESTKEDRVRGVYAMLSGTVQGRKNYYPTFYDEWIKIVPDNLKTFLESNYQKLTGKTVSGDTIQVSSPLNVIKEETEKAIDRLSLYGFKTSEVEKITDKVINSIDANTNVIVEGVAGSGKTYLLKDLRKSGIFGENGDRIEVVVFHPATSYEDFVIGLRPNNHRDDVVLKSSTKAVRDGKIKNLIDETIEKFSLETDAASIREELQRKLDEVVEVDVDFKSPEFVAVPGVFLDMCMRAAANPREPYLLFIDEINRANTAKVLGDLLMVIEGTKRTNFRAFAEDGYSALSVASRENSFRNWLAQRLSSSAVSSYVNVLKNADKIITTLDLGGKIKENLFSYGTSQEFTHIRQLIERDGERWTQLNLKGNENGFPRAAVIKYSEFLNTLALFGKAVTSKAISSKRGVNSENVNFVRLQTELREPFGEIDINRRYRLGNEGHYLLVPDNLYIIGTMNTSDRSVGTIDLALRRRFAWISQEPLGSSNESVDDILNTIVEGREASGQQLVNRDRLKDVVEWFAKTNQTLKKEIGPDAQLGHSYFFTGDLESIKQKLNDQLAEIANTFRIQKKWLNGEGLLDKDVSINDNTLGLGVRSVGNGLGQRYLAGPDKDNRPVSPENNQAAGNAVKSEHTTTEAEKGFEEVVPEQNAESEIENGFGA